MAMAIGYKRAGMPGLLVAGGCFILPAAGLTLLLAWLYVRYATLPWLQPALAGLAPAVVVVGCHGRDRRRGHAHAWRQSGSEPMGTDSRPGVGPCRRWGSRCRRCADSWNCRQRARGWITMIGDRSAGLQACRATAEVRSAKCEVQSCDSCATVLISKLDPGRVLWRRRLGTAS
ncbi:MAG: chromate transporter [Vicinamibacteria bacterium]|nr:chromate transporter [Vicinamibacteria bacterium]